MGYTLSGGRFSKWEIQYIVGPNVIHLMTIDKLQVHNPSFCTLCIM